MREDEFTVEMPFDDTIECVASSFIGGDPLPGIDKDCYCDNKGVVPEEEVEDQIYYWEDILAEQAAAEEEARAEAEAEAAR